MTKTKLWGWRLLFMLSAAAMRFTALNQIPPGLTHDEATHGLSAWGVVQGTWPLYFSIGYGREPLYDYATAVFMLFLGPTSLAGRLVSVFFSLILLATTYAWVRRAFNERIALLTMVGQVSSFWVLMVSRHGLRTMTMPALFTLAVLFWWHATQRKGKPVEWRWPLVAGLFLGLTFYTYMPARVMWLLFPALLGLWFLFDRDRFAHSWRPTAVSLTTAALLAAPLFLTLQFFNPSAETRLDQLRAPLDAALAGDFAPLLANSWAGMRIFIWEGDSAWRYNIAGEPLLGSLLGSLLGLFFGLGLLTAVWGIFRRGNTFQNVQFNKWGLVTAVLWLLLGLSPVLITGAELSITRAIGLLPVAYLFPALFLDTLMRAGVAAGDGSRSNYIWLARLAIVLIFIYQGMLTVQGYFFDWANAPEVRLHYETALVETISYLNENGQGVVTLSTQTPGQYHSPLVGWLTQGNTELDLRYFNGTRSLLLPAVPTQTVTFTGQSALAPELAALWAEQVTEQAILPLLETDVERPVTIQGVNTAVVRTQLPSQFTPPPSPSFIGPNQELELLGYQIAVQQAQEPVTILTLWRVHAPLGQADLVLFTQQLSQDGQPLTQEDRLDFPSEQWQSGDYFIQMHRLPPPTQPSPETGSFIIGLYQCADELCQQTIRFPTTFGDSITLHPAP